nr:MAG TPA_asm: hypothetical protein [Caudoviricetes sp.]
MFSGVSSRKSMRVFIASLVIRFFFITDSFLL